MDLSLILKVCRIHWNFACQLSLCEWPVPLIPPNNIGFASMKENEKLPVLNSKWVFFFSQGSWHCLRAGWWLWHVYQYFSLCLKICRDILFTLKKSWCKHSDRLSKWRQVLYYNIPLLHTGAFKLCNGQESIFHRMGPITVWLYDVWIQQGVDPEGDNPDDITGMKCRVTYAHVSWNDPGCLKTLLKSFISKVCWTFLIVIFSFHLPGMGRAGFL